MRLGALRVREFYGRCWMKHPLERLLKKLVPYD